MKKILTLLLLVTVLVTALTVPALAAEEATEENASEENLFEICYGEIMKHSDKILSALAFLGTLIIAFAYKKGFLPIVKGALNALSASVAGLKEEAERTTLESSERLDSAVSLIDGMVERLSSLEKGLTAARDEQAKSADMKTIMKAQIEMLYEVFMSSSLPAYQKESIGERIAEMKKTLSAPSGEAGEE